MTAPSRAKFQPTALHNITQTLTFLVPGGRVELPWCRHRRILSPLRLPFRHPGFPRHIAEFSFTLSASWLASVRYVLILAAAVLKSRSSIVLYRRNICTDL